MRSTRFIILAAVSFALSLIALAGISLPELNGFEAVNYTVGTRPVSVAVGDFNGDNKHDFAVANSDSPSVSVLFGQGDGTFQAAVSYPAGAGPNSFIAINVNTDGILDLVTTNASSNNISVLLGDVGGTFQPPVNYAVGARPNAVASGHFNSDFKLDLVVANRLNNNVSVLSPQTLARRPAKER